ncbi:unnamed protein product [Linum trigynum]|uniref:Uncharacterized protein n=1 Tax=Linum trigynum TaxID=586398 RepID=A0AAV2FYG1_9ROSI
MEEEISGRGGVASVKVEALANWGTGDRRVDTLKNDGLGAVRGRQLWRGEGGFSIKRSKRGPLKIGGISSIDEAARKVVAMLESTGGSRSGRERKFRSGVPGGDGEGGVWCELPPHFLKETHGENELLTF